MNNKFVTLSVALFLCVFALSSNALDIRHNALKMEFVLIPAGSFLMGTSKEDLDKVLFEMEQADMVQIIDESPRHSVTLSKPFLLGRTEITQSQWYKVMGTRPGPAEGWNDKNWQTLPVVSTSWNMAQQFISKLNKLDARYRYRLPSEAEWEYAAREGSNEIRPMPLENLDDYAWSMKNSGDVPHPVATRKPNAFGLYDMLGNAWEWVNDRHGEYPSDSVSDPVGPSKGVHAIRRGGSYHCPLFEMRPAFRSPDPSPDTKYTVTGFRVIAIKK